MSTAALIRNQIIQREGANAPGLPGRHATMSMVARPVRHIHGDLLAKCVQSAAAAPQAATAPGGFPQRRMSSAAIIKELALKKRTAAQGTDGRQVRCGCESLIVLQVRQVRRRPQC